MPYDVRKTSDGQYHVFNQQTGEDKGVSKTRTKAEAHMRALYANEPRSMSSPGMKMGGVEGMTVDDSYAPVPITHAYMNGKRYPVMAAAVGDKELTALHDEHVAPVSVATATAAPASATTSKETTPGFLGGGILANLKNLKGKKTTKKAPVEGSPAEEKGESKAVEAKEVAAGTEKPTKSLPPWMAKFKKKTAK